MSRSIDLSHLSWQVTPCPPTALTPDPKNAIDAVVPGGILLDLERAGKIEDPFYAENFRACAWADKWTYWYECRFTASQLEITSPKRGQKRELLFEGIDTFGEVWLNGNRLGQVQNMFRRHGFDVTEQLDYRGENILQIRIDPVIESTQKWCEENNVDCSKKWMSFDIQERIAARKMQMSYGWDNSPHLLTGGIFRPVQLIQHNACALKEIHWHVKSLEPTAQKAVLCVQGSIENSQTPQAGQRTVQIQGNCRDHQFAGEAQVGRDGLWEVTVEMEKPYLWWPTTLGDPDQYQTQVTLIDDAGKLMDESEFKIGIRTLEIITTPAVKQLVSQVTGRQAKTLEMDGGDTGAWSHVPLDPPELRDVYPFHLMVNGVHVFIRGVDWQTPDAIPGRVNQEQVKGLLDAAIWANVNLIRLWGGGTVEPDYFYEMCSEMGLLVWQDFHFACGQYPDEQAFWMKFKLKR